MSDIASRTIVGSYQLVKMPNGDEVMMHQLTDGRWVTTEERLRQEEFSARFEGTDFKPAPASVAKTEVLEKKEDAPGSGQTKNNLEAYLVEMLGIPEDILAGKVTPEVKYEGIRRHARGLARVLNSPKWNAVIAKLGAAGKI